MTTYGEDDYFAVLLDRSFQIKPSPLTLNFKENTISVTIKIKVLIWRPFLPVTSLPDRHRSEIAESNIRGTYKMDYIEN